MAVIHQDPMPLSEPLKIQYKPVTHVENFCATASEALATLNE